MYKTFKTDSERNAYFTHLSNVCDVPDNVKYVNGVLYKNNEIITDKVFIGNMENMFDSLNQLAALNKVVA